MASSGLLLLFAALTGIGFAIGTMNVWSIAMAEHHHQDMLSGIIPAAFSTGSFLGGLVYGRRTWSGTTTRRLVITSGAFLAGWLPLLALTGPYAVIAAVAVPGALLTIVVASAYITTEALTPADRTSEAYAWLILAIGAGQSAGTALAGRLAAQPLARAALPAAGTRRPDQGATPLLSNPFEEIHSWPLLVERDVPKCGMPATCAAVVRLRAEGCDTWDGDVPRLSPFR
ncbi:hypothetical protein ACWFRJ_11010 [Streptomyces sp. NPDC055239]